MTAARNLLPFLSLLVPQLSLSQTQEQEQTPIIPIGSLSAFPTIVQTGTKPQLTWDITLPEKVDDIVDIIEPGTIVTKRDLVVDIRILGAGVTVQANNSQGYNFVPTQCQVSFNGHPYEVVFYGTNEDVDPSLIVFTADAPEGSIVNVGARYYHNNSWGPWFSSTNNNYNVVALRNGDTPPTTTPMYQAPTIESFILPYLDENGDISLGARDVIYLMELTHTDRNHGGWDLQDMAILVTFYDEVSEGSGNEASTMVDGSGKSNNGHGNNIDGVDSSNPGNSKVGTDSDPNVDDEGKKKKKRRKK